jgi:hypothetical protein
VIRDRAKRGRDSRNEGTVFGQPVARPAPGNVLD